MLLGAQKLVHQVFIEIVAEVCENVQFVYDCIV